MRETRCFIKFLVFLIAGQVSLANANMDTCHTEHSDHHSDEFAHNISSDVNPLVEDLSDSNTCCQLYGSCSYLVPTSSDYKLFGVHSPLLSELKHFHSPPILRLPLRPPIT